MRQAAFRLAAVGLAAAGFAVLGACMSLEEPNVADNPRDPKSEAHLWLEDVEGADALAWVRAENERTLKVLEGDQRFQGYYDAALRIATSAERIPHGAVRNGQVYNFWQDGAGFVSAGKLGRSRPKLVQATLHVGAGVTTVTIRAQYLRGLGGFAPLSS